MVIIDQHVTMPLVIVKGEVPSIFGRNCLQGMKLDWLATYELQKDAPESMLSTHFAVFEETLGMLQGFNAQVYIDPAATPKFCEAKTVPYVYQAIVETELNRL